MEENRGPDIPKDLVETIVKKLGESIDHTPFTDLKHRVLSIYRQAFCNSEISNKVFYIEGKVTNRPRIHRLKNSVTFSIVNNDGIKFDIYVPSNRNLLNNIYQGCIVGLKGKLHFYQDGIVNGYDYIQFQADEVTNLGAIRHDYSPLLQFVKNNKKKKAIKLFLKKEYKIALITSETSEAIQDVENNLGHKSFYKIEKHFTNLYSPEEIAKTINYVDQLGYDAILIARGGVNKVEIFNDYIILNSLFKCKTTVMTAIGHASFRSLSDIIADYAFDTPSVAALKLNNIKTEHNRKRNNHVALTLVGAVAIVYIYFKLKYVLKWF